MGSDFTTAPPARASAPSPAKTSPLVDIPADARPSQDAGAPRPASLFEEQSIIERARAALARGDTGGALATLDRYDRQYAQKQFGPEALAMRIEALRAEGQHGLARLLARNFERRYPHHPLLLRVQGQGKGR